MIYDTRINTDKMAAFVENSSLRLKRSISALKKTIISSSSLSSKPYPSAYKPDVEMSATQGEFEELNKPE